MPESIYPYDFTCTCHQCKSCQRRQEITSEVRWRVRVMSHLFTMCVCGKFSYFFGVLSMLSEIYHGLGKVSVNNRLNFAILFIITISLRPAQNTVTQPCWKRVSPARGWRRVYTGLLAFGPPWKIEIVFSQVFGLLLMVTMISHHHHQLWFRSEILKYGVSNLPMAEKRAFAAQWRPY